MTLSEMKLGRPSPSALFPPTIEGFLAGDGGLRISPNSLKTWWPGTELNRRRQPFQCALSFTGSRTGWTRRHDETKNSPLLESATYRIGRCYQRRVGRCAGDGILIRTHWQ